MRRSYLLLAILALSLMGLTPLAAQQVGQSITLTGCLVQDDDDDEIEFLLEAVTGTAISAEEVELEPAEGVDLAAHVGHLVEVSGTVIADDDEDEGEEDEHDDDDDELHVRVTRMGHRAASCG